jgi:hypothetical protein
VFGEKSAILILASQFFAMWLEVKGGKTAISGGSPWMNTLQFRKVFAHFLSVSALLCVWRVIMWQSIWNGAVEFGNPWQNSLRLWELNVVGKVHTMYWVSMFNYAMCPFTHMLRKVKRSLEYRLNDTKRYQFDRDVSAEDAADVRLSMVLWQLFYPSTATVVRKKVYRAAIGYYVTQGTLLPRELWLLSMSVRDSLGLRPVKIVKGRRNSRGSARASDKL